MPTCAGADTGWRSTSAGWEKLDTVTFADGRAMVALDHFCDLVITGERVPLKCLGFLHPQGEHAEIVVMHVGCKSCQTGLELLCSDEDVLQPLRACWPSLQLGMFRRATSWKSIRLARHRNSSCGLIKCHWCADSMPSRGYSLMWRSTERTTPSKLLRLFRVQQGDSLEGPSWRDGGNACGRNFPGVLSQNIGCPSFLVSSFFTYFLGVNQV